MANGEPLKVVDEERSVALQRCAPTVRDFAEAFAGCLARDDSIEETARVVTALFGSQPTVAEVARRAAVDELNAAADAIQALHPGEVKNSVIFLRGRAAARERGELRG